MIADASQRVAASRECARLLIGGCCWCCWCQEQVTSTSEAARLAGEHTTGSYDGWNETDEQWQRLGKRAQYGWTQGSQAKGLSHWPPRAWSFVWTMSIVRFAMTYCRSSISHKPLRLRKRPWSATSHQLHVTVKEEGPRRRWYLRSVKTLWWGWRTCPRCGFLVSARTMRTKFPTSTVGARHAAASKEIEIASSDRMKYCDTTNAQTSSVKHRASPFISLPCSQRKYSLYPEFEE